MRSLALAALLLLTAAPALATSIDSMQITHDLAEPVDANGDPVTFDGNPTQYRLGGQSAFIQSRTSSGTSGGQLDGAAGFGDIHFIEAFPPALLSEYQTYSYLGIVGLDGTDANGDPILLDQSLVIAFQPGVAEGLRVEDLFPAYTESGLVAAFTTQFDSPEFLDMAFGLVGGQPSTSGRMSVNETDCSFQFTCPGATQIQSGETLDLIAFVGGPNGDQGVVIGTLAFGMTRSLNLPVPEPTPLALFAMGTLGLCVAGCARRGA